MLQPVAERCATSLTPTLVREHPPRDAVQPRPSSVAVGDAREPAPRHQEGVRGDVCGVVGAVGAAERETEHRVEMRLVQVAEGDVPSIELTHVPPMSGQ
jgi:hypothetical protein